MKIALLNAVINLVSEARPKIVWLYACSFLHLDSSHAPLSLYTRKAAGVLMPSSVEVPKHNIKLLFCCYS